MLICIPDISGFTRFMKEINFADSSKIITALLNKIIYSNFMNLQVSEIEGDAVLFFTDGPIPSFRTLIEQCKSFYTEFYAEMFSIADSYNEGKKPQRTPDMLGLKIIVHYSEQIGMAQIGTHIKLLGEDVIVAHRFLKNGLEENEYLLLSDETMRYYEKAEKHYLDWGQLKPGHIMENDLGRKDFSYIDLTGLVWPIVLL